MEERLTKKERKEQKKLERMENLEKSHGNSKMKGIIIAAVALLFLGFFVFAIVASKKKTTEPVKLSSSGWVRGNLESPVTLTEFGDFQCPACKAFEPTWEQVTKEYDSKVKFVYKHFPLKAAHPNAMKAAVASEAAGKQNKFWEYHDLLFLKQEEWASLPDPSKKFVSYAKSLKLDTAIFEKDMKDKKLSETVNSQLDEGIEAGVNGTPTLFINGKQIDIPGNFQQLKVQIDKVLKEKNG